MHRSRTSQKQSNQNLEIGNIPSIPGSFVSNQCEIEEIFPVPKDRIRFIIGKEHQQIKKIMKSTSASVEKIDKTTEDDNVVWGYFKISGTSNQVERAKRLMMNVLLKTSNVQLRPR